VNGHGSKGVALVPTNNVTTKDGVTVRARIDPTLTVEDVVKQLCLNLKIKDPPVMFALRDEMDDLVTNDNLRKKITTKLNLKYVHQFFWVACCVDVDTIRAWLDLLMLLRWRLLR
jgi:engulfment/cell motility protein 1